MDHSCTAMPSAPNDHPVSLDNVQGAPGCPAEAVDQQQHALATRAPPIEGQSDGATPLPMESAVAGSMQGGYQGVMNQQ